MTSPSPIVARPPLLPIRWLSARLARLKGVAAEGLLLALVASGMLAVFLFDVATPPDDVSVCFTYAALISLASFSRYRLAYAFAAVATVLSVIGSFLHTPGEALSAVFFTNRAIAIAAQWLVAYVVAARKDAEAHMRAQFEQEREKVETSRRFIDVLSHEIGTSLTTIDGQAFRLRKLAGSHEPADVAVRADKIRTAVRHIQAVVEQVQLASEVEGAVPTWTTAVDLRGLVADCVAQSEAERTISTELSELPPLVWADADMLRQTIANLLSNAVKYSAAETPIQVRGWSEAEHAVLAITDQGRGIPEEERVNLFAPYYRASNSRGVHGTGIGLYVAERVIARHGGTIAIDSALGRGTTVTVRIPVRRGSAEDADVPPAHSVH
jgi:signal transduction histidine kinase